MSEAAVKAPTREIATDLLRYWEPRRLVYNAALVVVCVVQFVTYLPGSRAAFTWDAALVGFLLAVVANVLYCAAYLADGFVQYTPFRTVWLRIRWLLFALGVAFATVLTHFIAKAYFCAVAQSGYNEA